MSDKYAVITAHRPTYSVQLMCDALDVAPSGYYAAQQRLPSARAVADEARWVHVRRCRPWGSASRRSALPA